MSQRLLAVRRCGAHRAAGPEPLDYLQNARVKALHQIFERRSTESKPKPSNSMAKTLAVSPRPCGQNPFAKTPLHPWASVSSSLLGRQRQTTETFLAVLLSCSLRGSMCRVCFANLTDVTLQWRLLRLARVQGIKSCAKVVPVPRTSEFFRPSMADPKKPAN